MSKRAIPTTKKVRVTYFMGTRTVRTDVEYVLQNRGDWQAELWPTVQAWCRAGTAHTPDCDKELITEDPLTHVPGLGEIDSLGALLTADCTCGKAHVLIAQLN